MRLSLRLLVVCAGCGLASLAGWPAGAWAEAPPSSGSLLSLSADPTTVEGVQVLAGGSEESAPLGPEASRLNTESEALYEGLSSSASAALATRVFPSVLDEAAGGPPPLQPGQTLEGFPTDNAMAVLDEGHHTIVESLQPIAVESASGRVPIDLGLDETGGRFAPRTPAAGVHLSLPRQLSEGPELSDLGIALTPVDEYGSPLQSEGSIQGATVFYGDDHGAGVEDLSTLAKPSTGGMDLVSVLSSKRSPERLYFKVGLPEGASLAQEGSGPVQVMDAGQAIATIEAPAGRDADGRFVALKLGVSGSVVTMTVERKPGQYDYPIEADPFLLADDQYLTGYGTPTNWQFCTSVSIGCAHEESPFRSTGWGGTSGLSDEATGSYAATSFAGFLYKTQGESKIVEATVTTEATNNENPGAEIETTLHTVNENGTDDYEQLLSASKNYGPTQTVTGDCLNCGGGKPENHNTVKFMQSATGSGSHFRDRMTSASVRISQEVDPTVTPDTTDQYLPVGGKSLNALYGNGVWMSEHQGVLGYKAEDKGVGVSDTKLRWSVYEEPWFEENLIAKAKCSGVQCPQSVEQEFTYQKNMLNGEHNVYFTVEDAAKGYAASSYVKLKVDTVPPTGLKVTGLPSSGVVDGVPYHLRAEATDGSAPTASSGIKSLVLGIDGFEIPGGKAGTCEPGPCAASGEWTLNGEEFGAGKHKLELVATDNAGNIQTKSYEITIRHASPIAVGPGSVDPITGALTLEAHDVSIGGGFGALGLSRSFDSRQPTAGEDGPLGPQWSLSLSGEQGVESEQTGDVTLVADDGSRTTFSSDGKGGFVAPKGDENLELSAEREGETVKAYLLKDPAKGTTLRFIHPSGASEDNLWVIEKAEGASSKENGEKLTYKWEAVEGVERPKEALAPALGVSCEPEPKVLTELKVGCRALSFVYASETNATGEAPGEWGEYKGRLTKVSFTAYDPVGKAMKTTAVAEYSYDKQGRLRAEWDPRISLALKTTYGYDAEGRVVAVSSPGQEPSLLHYGALAGDAAPGRLLSAIRPPASAKLETGLAPGNESKPSLSTTTPAIGTTLGVASNGSWSGSPLAYVYQWQDCDANGEKCQPIPGAVNESYTPQARDSGYTLEVTVTALNADGTGSASSSPTSAVSLSAPTYSTKFGTLGEGAGQVKNPTGVAVDASGDVWVSDHNNNRLDEFSASGSFVKAIGWGVVDGEYHFETCTTSCRAGRAGYAEGMFSSPDGLAIGGEDIYVADAGNNRIEVMSTNGEYVREFGAGAMPVAVALAPNGDVWTADRTNDRIDEFNESGSFVGSFGTAGNGNGQFKEPGGIAFSGEYAYVVDSGDNRVEQFTLSGDYVAQFGSAGTGSGQFSSPAQIATEPISGDLYVADSSNSRVQEFNPAGAFLASIGGAGTGNGQFKGVEAITVTPSGSLYAADLNNNRVQQFKPNYSTNDPAPEPPNVGANAVTTLAYRVPVSGSGAPHQLGAEEAKRWGQEDDPAEATAVFAPDEPMGWPAKDYTKATISYFDNLGRTVNLASPSGAISTREYNETNNVKRTLTASNRAKALEEGAKSAEVAKNLDTEYDYNVLNTGTELAGVVGPEHEKTRHNTTYYYDENAPAEGGPYHLVTKKTESGGHTTVMSYSGQNGLGWKLREPTSVTTDPEGLDLVHTTVYDPATGNVVETRTPRSEAVASVATHSSQFGESGEGSGQFASPGGVAVDPEGHIWVVDEGQSHVDEFSATGEYIREVGSAGEGNGQFGTPGGVAASPEGYIWVVDRGNGRVEEFSHTGSYVRKFGSYGEGPGQFTEPTGIAVDRYGNVWVLDRYSGRVQEFSSTGTYIRQFSSSGDGSGQLYEPQGIAVDRSEHVWIADTGNARVQEFSETGEHIREVRVLGKAAKSFEHPVTVAMDKSGDAWVGDDNDRVVELSPTGEYLGLFKLSAGAYVTGVAFDSKWHLRVVDSGNSRVEEWVPKTKPTDPLESQTIYYTAASNSQVPACGGRPEWANLPCHSQPAAQPLEGVALPVVTDTYNMWDEAETVTEEFGSTTRTKKSAYDAAGRLVGSEVTSTLGTALPKVTDEYDPSTGAMVKQSTTTGGTTRTITSGYNKLGQLVEYTDADANKSTYTYDLDGRVSEMSDGKGTQTYAYDPTTGALIKLFDATSGITFTAGYDLEGRLTSETYPNGMTAKYVYDELGQVTHVEYVKETNCSEKCVWFSEAVSYLVGGEVSSRTSSLAKELYSYDAAGRLTEVQETPVGKGCTVRLYAYDEDSNRLSLTTREPGREGSCALLGGSVEEHAYDEADRLSDPGTSYDAFGNTLTLPTADSGGHEIKSTYYVSNQTHSTAQNGKTITYELDPNARSREIVTEEGASKTAVINHYPGPGAAVAWCGEGGEKYTRNVPGIDGALSAVEKNGEAPVLQLHDLQGNIVATAAVSGTETKVLSTYNSTEFGVPVNGTPPTKYSWLGATGVSAELSSGASAASGAGYVPQLGQPLQTQAIVPPGAAPEGTYISPYISTVSAADWQASAAYAAEAPTREAARQKLAEKETEEKAKAGCSIASMCVQPEAEPEEGGGEEGIEVAVDEREEGTGAHTASGEPAIACEIRADHPHRSKHFPETINFELWAVCTGSVFNLRLRAALFYNNGLVGETGYVPMGNGSEGMVRVVVPCRSGWYQGWGYADWKLPRDYEGPRKTAGWGVRVKVRC